MQHIVVLELVEAGEHTSAGNATENVGTSTLEQGRDTLVADDLHAAVEGALVLDLLTRGHHHTTTDGVKRVGGETGSDGHHPAKSERGQEAVSEVAREQHGLQGVVEAEVAATVDDDADAGHDEATVQASNAILNDES